MRKALIVLAVLLAVPVFAATATNAKSKPKPKQERDIHTQQEFVDVATLFSKRFERTANLTPEWIRTSTERRKASLRSALHGLSIKGWTGVLKRNERDGDGNVELMIEVGENILLSSVLPAKNERQKPQRALIQPSSPAFEALKKLKAGDRVIFDGNFFADRQKGENKGGLVGNRSFTNPEFLFQVSELKNAKKGKLRTAVEKVRAEIAAFHAAGGGSMHLIDFAKTLGLKIKGETEEILLKRGDMVFKKTSANGGEFTNTGKEHSLKLKIGQVSVPETLHGTYICTPRKLQMTFDKDHTLIGRLAVIVVPLEVITANSDSIDVKVGGIMGGALSRAVPLD